MLYAGWDWAAESHDVTVMDKTATVIDRWAMSHDAHGIDAALKRLTQLGQPESTLVAIEAKRGW